MKPTGYSSAIIETESIDDFLLESYQMSIDSGELDADPFQRQVVFALQEVVNTLLSSNKYDHQPSFFKRLFPLFSPHATPIRKGLYLWGGVGRGKTLLVDYFFRLVPIDKKLRLHFHRFMQLVHEELATLKHVSDPLKVVADKLAGRIDLLCLDEMHVNDITDAMLLGQLFKYLFDHNIILVTTSNYAPQDLYKKGLQRDRFTPAIQLLEKYTEVLKIGGDEDYRLRTLEQSAVYHLSSGELSECRLQHYFRLLVAIERHQDRTDIIIKQRCIPVKMWADGVVWFDFDQLCNTARSTDDYIQIANIFHTVLISNIPLMDANKDDVARRFVNMIDEFYNLRVNLVVSAAAQPEALYLGNRLKFEFKRTVSRLHEMQSKEYMAVKHLS
jgi:cell division protein ZapE